MVNRKRERDLIWTQKPDSSPFSSSTDSTSSDRNPSESISTQCRLDSCAVGYPWSKLFHLLIISSIFLVDFTKVVRKISFENNWCIMLILSFIWRIWGWSGSHAELATVLPVDACPPDFHQRHSQYSTSYALPSPAIPPSETVKNCRSFKAGDGLYHHNPHKADLIYWMKHDPAKERRDRLIIVDAPPAL